MRIAEALGIAENALKECSIDEADLNAQWLCAHVLGRSRLDVLAFRNDEMPRERIKTFFSLVERKSRGEPLSYITGTQNFMGLSLQVGEGVLIPRPETEGLVERAKALLADAEISAPAIADIGTGSGAIACAMAKQIPQASVSATDISTKALAYAQRNAGLNGLTGWITFLECDLFGSLKGPFDMVVSNPPYINSKDMETLPTEVRYEPQCALFGGEDGLAVVRRLIAFSPMFLKPGCWLCMECGDGQPAAAARSADAAHWSEARALRDDFGKERYLFLRRANG